MQVFYGMEIISSGHMNVEKEVFNPHRRVCCPVILLDVYGLKPIEELVLHHFIYKTHWVCGTPEPGHIALEIGCHPDTMLLPGSIVLVTTGLVSIPSYGSVPSRTVDGSFLACSGS